MIKNLLFIILILFNLTVFAKPVTDTDTDTVTKVKPSKEAIALTFDDGPDPKYTPKILDILDNHNIKATFFVTGEKAEQYPELIKEIKKRGHYIANHSYNHKKLNKIPSKQYQWQISHTNSIIYEITGTKLTCLRPPYGLHNQRIDAYANSQGLEVITWDLNSFDYKKGGAEKIAKWVLDNTHGGYVLLFHDGGGNRSQTIHALPLIIEGLENKFYTFETICMDN